MITPQKALQQLLQLVSPIERVESVSLTAALGRVLAADVVAPGDLPEFDNSAMDGYAVRGQDLQSLPVDLRVVAEIAAETMPQTKLGGGECARIFTGGILPQGADTIVVQEDTVRKGDTVQVLQAIPVGTFVRRRGEYCPKGGLVLSRGTTIGATEIGILASVQHLEISVYERPVVALISTGNELIFPTEPKLPGQIVDSNQYALVSLISQGGGIPLFMGIVPDRADLLEARLIEALEQADLVLTSGGASVGEYDYLGEVLTKIGAEIAYRSVAMKPGKPITVASYKGKVTIGLPGNPASSLVGFWRLGQFALAKLQGSKDYQPQIFFCPTVAKMQGVAKRESYLWGQLVVIDHTLWFKPNPGSQNSGNLIGLAHTSALAIVSPDCTIEKNDLVEVLLPNAIGRRTKV